MRPSLAPLAVIGWLLFNGLVLSDPLGAGHKDSDGIELYPADKIKWQEGPPSLPKGAMIAVLEGNPGKEGPFVFRVKIPDGYRVPPHTHPKTERITVISGTFNVGMGDKFDQAATKPMPAGTYGYWPAGMKHFVWAKGETVLQFHGMGPWSIQYLNPDDDPRKKAGKKDTSAKSDVSSGPQTGLNLPGPFLSLVAHAEDPGLVAKKIDFVEMYGQSPVVLLFARQMTKPLGRLVRSLDAEAAKPRSGKLRIVVVFLSDNDSLESELQTYAQKQGLKRVALAMMERTGPRLYNLSTKADTTVVLYKRQKVEANHAFAAGELNDDSAERILLDAAKLVAP